MANIDYIVSIDGINDRISFFDSLLSFYAPLDVILTTWGKLPAEAKVCLSSFELPCSWLRRLVARETSWHLNKQSKGLIAECFCKDHILEAVTWGIRKGDTPLWLCRNWNDMNADGSNLIDDDTLFGWLENLKVKGIIDSYEKIIGL